jgi:hypothetical protein
MSTKFVRFVAALAVIISIVGNTGVASADHGAPPSVSAQNLDASALPLVAAQRPPRAPEPRTLDIPALTIPPTSSLGVQFVHVATAANSAGDYTIIDHPLTNGNPNAIILVTPNWNPGGVGSIYDNHPIGVYYASGKWRIFNQDIAAMPVGAAFNVIIPTTGAGVFVHTATFVYGNHTFINSALTDGNPNAIVFVTPNWNPGGVCGCVYANYPIGVYYDSIASKWAILNQNVGAMPDNAAFNVFVLTAGAGVFVHTATAGNSSDNSTYIDNALTNGHPNAIVFVTPNWNPGGVGSTYANFPIGVYYDGLASKWAIFNQNGILSSMPLNAAFNVLVLVPASDIFVHTATAGSSAGNYTTIDNALTNSHPNAIAFTTPNWNPGGVGGTYDNHNIGVWYNSTTSQWAIFNQDIAAIPVNAAFNVLVPNPDTSVFVHKATAANISLHTTILDYPLTNGKPNAILLVTPNWNPGNVGGTYDNHPIGVYYTGGKWRIFNQDFAAIPDGASFNVFVPAAGTGVFVHTASVSNSSFDSTILDNALTNGNPNAIVVVTPNWNPGGLGGTYNNHPIGVYYDGSKWRIFNQDLAAIPVNAAFNVYVYVYGNYKIYLPLVTR